MRPPLVLVPGTMASELYGEGRRLWPPRGPIEVAQALQRIDVEATSKAILRTVRVGLGVRRYWEPFLDRLRVDLGYREGVDLFPFGYDWRRDVRTAAAELAAAFDLFEAAVRAHRAVPADQPVRFVLVAHSLGTVVCRWFVDQLGGHRRVSHQLLVAAVDRGNAATFRYLVQGMNQPRPLVQPTPWDPLLRLGPSYLSAIRKLVPLYQQLPLEPFVDTPEGPLDVSRDTSWIEDDRDAAEVRARVGSAGSVLHAIARPPRVPTTYLYGTGKDTAARYYLRRGREGWDWSRMETGYASGDGIVVSHTARASDLRADVTVHTVVAGHQELTNHERFHQLIVEIVRSHQRVTTTGPLRRAWITYLWRRAELDQAAHHSGGRVIDLDARLAVPQPIEAVLAAPELGRQTLLLGRVDLRGAAWQLARRHLEGRDPVVPWWLPAGPGPTFERLLAASAAAGLGPEPTIDLLTHEPGLLLTEQIDTWDDVQALARRFPRLQIVARDPTRSMADAARTTGARVYALSFAARTFRFVVAVQRSTGQPTYAASVAVWRSGAAGPRWEPHTVTRESEVVLELPIDPRTGIERPIVLHASPFVNDEPLPGQDVPPDGAPRVLPSFGGDDLRVRVRFDLNGASVADLTVTLVHHAGSGPLPFALRAGLENELHVLLVTQATHEAPHVVLDRWSAGLDPTIAPAALRLETPADRLARLLSACLDAGRRPDGSLPAESLLLGAARRAPSAPLVAQTLQTFRSSRWLALDDHAAGDLERVRREATVGPTEDLLPARFAADLERAARAVALLTVPLHRAGVDLKEKVQGTGWLITRTLLVTNHHVVAYPAPDRFVDPADVTRQALGTEVAFYLQPDGKDPTRVGVVGLVYTDAEADIAVLRLTPEPGPEPLSIAADPVRLADGAVRAANIIQHPSGGDKRIALRNNLIASTSADGTQIRYFADTREGSSGAPVLDDDLRVIAVHLGGRLLPQGGAAYNIGVQIRTVLAALAGTPLGEEIEGG